jgi:predicted kinase
VLELGLVGRAEREAFHHRVDGTHHALTVYLLEPPRDVRRQRVRQRNAERSGTFRMEVSDEIFDLADRAWQPPDASERAARRILEVADSRAPVDPFLRARGD